MRSRFHQGTGLAFLLWSAPLFITAAPAFRHAALEAPKAEAPRLEAGLKIEYPGLQGNEVVVRMLIFIPARALPAEMERAEPWLSVEGEVLRHGDRLETFIYILHGRRTDGGVLLAFERCLAPGSYELRLSVENEKSGIVLVADRHLQVPVIQMTALPLREGSDGKEDQAAVRGRGHAHVPPGSVPGGHG